MDTVEIPENLLFLPQKVAEIALLLKTDLTPSLLQRSLDTFDWRLEDLWKVAVYYHLLHAYPQALPYYFKLLQWTEHNAEQHAEVLCAIAHVFLSSREYEDAERMFRIALKKSEKPGKIPYFMAQIFAEKHQFQKQYQALNFFCENYSEANALKLQAQFQQTMILNRVGSSDALVLLKKAAQEHQSWETQFLTSTFAPYLPFLSHEPLAQKHKEMEAAESLLEELRYGDLATWPLAHWSKHIDVSSPEFRRYEEYALAQITKRVDFLRHHVLATDETNTLKASLSGKRVMLIGNFYQGSLGALTSLWIQLCREHSVSLTCINGIPLDLKEEHWMRVINVNPNLAELFRTVSSQKPDIIVYLQGLHTGSSQIFLSTQRLAKTQYVFASSPNLVVPENIDKIFVYSPFVASTQAAYPDSKDKIQSLEGTPLKKVSQHGIALGREKFNLKEDRNYYFCPLPVPFIHKDFYAICESILELDEQGEIFVCASDAPEGERLFKKHLQAHYPLCYERLHILPPLSVVAQHALIEHVNVILDPIYSGLGHDLWELMPIGTPVVTWKGPSPSGQWATDLYAHAGWTESCVSNLEDYAKRAVSLAQTPDVKTACAAAFSSGFFDLESLYSSFETLIFQNVSENKELT